MVTKSLRRPAAFLSSIAMFAAVPLVVPATMSTAEAASPRGANCAARNVASADRGYASLGGKAMISVASYNIQGQNAGGWTNWPGRRDAVAGMISTCMPDVVAVQEGAESWVRRTKSASTQRSLAQYEDLIDEVNRDLTNYSDLYKVTNRYRKVCPPQSNKQYPAEWNGQWRGASAPWRTCVNDAYKTPRSPSDNRILFNSRTVEPLKQGFRNLSSKSTRRTVAWTIFRDKSTKRVFLVANTHFEAGASSSIEAFRVKQAKQALAAIKSARNYGGRNIPTFFVGDLNSSRYSERFTAADQVKKAGYTDILGHDRRWKPNRSGKGNCTRLGATAPRVPHQASRFIDVIYNTSNGGTNFCAYRGGSSSKGKLPQSEWWKFNGSAIDYIFVSGAVRARTWETVVDGAVSNGMPTYRSRPSDHNMIMTYAYL